MAQIAIFIPSLSMVKLYSLPGEIVLAADIRMIVTAGNRQKGIKEGDADGHGHDINQIVFHRPFCISENKFSIHGFLPLRSW